MNRSTLKSHSDIFLHGLSCQVGQEAMDAVKRLLATEGQSRSVMKESSLWSVVVKREKLNRFCLRVCVFMYLPLIDY